MSIIQLEIDDAVNEIINHPAPILFIDTCTLLDIIRLPFRQKKSTTAKAYLDSAENAIQLIKDNKLRIVILPLILKEFGDNLPGTEDELSRHVKNLSSSLEILYSLHSKSHDKLIVPDLLSFKTELILKKICNDLLELGIHVKQNDDTTLRANNRVIMNIPPSRKGTLKDCIIYEHCLEMAALLRNQGFNEKMVFFTSNTEDFCENKIKAKQPIHNELSNFNIGLCVNWTWAIHEILPSQPGD